MEIVQERLERNYNLDLIATSPSVVFRVTLTDGTVEMIDNPAKLPARDKIALMEEPYVKATVITPPDYVGAIMELTQTRRGTLQNMEYLARRPRDPHVRDAADRGDHRLLRPAQVARPRATPRSITNRSATAKAIS